MDAIPALTCDSRSDATCAGLAPPSAITSTSEGPAGMSIEIIASLFCSSILAAVTYWLPGPKILSTLGHVAVPHARAATACRVGGVVTIRVKNWIRRQTNDVSVCLGHVAASHARAATACRGGVVMTGVK